MWKGGAWAKVGDWVIIPRNTAGGKLSIGGESYRLINDDQVIATIEDPKDIKVYV